jgi:hypothetical protein
MQINITKEQLIRLKTGHEISEKSILNLYTPTEPLSLTNTLSPPCDVGVFAEEALRNPDYIVGINFVNPYTFFDTKISFKDQSAVSLLSDGDDFLLETPLNKIDTLTGIQLYTGNSPILISDLSVRLTETALWTFATLLDFFRFRHNLIAINQKPFKVTEEELNTFNQSFKEDVTCLRSYIKPLIPAVTALALDELMIKTVLQKSDGGYYLDHSIHALFCHFLAIDNYLKVDAIGNVTAGFMAVQSGIYNVLYVEKYEKDYLVQTLAPAILLELIDDMMSKNEKMMVDLQRNHKNFCSACGTKLNPDAKFCPNCGKKV